MNTLPQAIAGYIDAANAQAPDRLATCFHADATVFDEGSVRRGRDEIAAWARETGMRYQSTIEPVGLEEAGGLHRLRATVRGHFPGSPIALHFNFLLESGSIQSLEIKP
ncbi:nuclear transport factor 2 family protein [Massilia niabensis]|uniref:Nuclear transport factor 2 family protein n=1 Tax=Massilia niabensis TaxID=544910 RepID=A0ABW0LA85_9BURK